MRRMRRERKEEGDGEGQSGRWGNVLSAEEMGNLERVEHAISSYSKPRPRPESERARFVELEVPAPIAQSARERSIHDVSILKPHSFMVPLVPTGRPPRPPTAPPPRRRRAAACRCRPWSRTVSCTCTGTGGGEQENVLSSRRGRGLAEPPGVSLGSWGRSARFAARHFRPRARRHRSKKPPQVAVP